MTARAAIAEGFADYLDWLDDGTEYCNGCDFCDVSIGWWLQWRGVQS